MQKALLVALALLIGAAAPAAAQSTSFGLGAFAGVSLPMGDFGDTEGSEAGLAELGFTGGLDLFYPIGPSGLSWLTSASVSAHSVEGADAGYLFIPVMTGARYDIAAGPVGVFLTGQLGGVFSKGPSDEALGMEVESDWNTGFGFALGGGVQATENIYAGVKYFPLGDIEFQYDDFTAEQNVSFLEIFVGFAAR